MNNLFLIKKINIVWYEKEQMHITQILFVCVIIILLIQSLKKKYTKSSSSHSITGISLFNYPSCSGSFENNSDNNFSADCSAALEEGNSCVLTVSDGFTGGSVICSNGEYVAESATTITIESNSCSGVFENNSDNNFSADCSAALEEGNSCVLTVSDGFTGGSVLCQGGIYATVPATAISSDENEEIRIELDNGIEIENGDSLGELFEIHESDGRGDPRVYYHNSSKELIGIFREDEKLIINLNEIRMNQIDEDIHGDYTFQLSYDSSILNVKRENTQSDGSGTNYFVLTTDNVDNVSVYEVTFEFLPIDAEGGVTENAYHIMAESDIFGETEERRLQRYIYTNMPLDKCLFMGTSDWDYFKLREE